MRLAEHTHEKRHSRNRGEDHGNYRSVLAPFASPGDGIPQEKVRKEAEDLLAQLQEAREKPQFVLLDKEGRRLLQAFTALLDKLEGWDPYDQKMADTFDAIMRHMSVLIGQSK